MAPLPAGTVAEWALIGVVAVVIIVRLRGDDFGRLLGGALIAIGGAALIVLCVAVRPEAGWHTDTGRPDSKAPRLPWEQRRFVIGTVVPGSISSWPATREHHFLIEDSSSRPRAVIHARYVGRLPDNFESGGAVLLRGTLAYDGEVFDVVPGGITTARDR